VLIIYSNQYIHYDTGRQTMTLELMPLSEDSAMVIAGQAANKAASRATFEDYRTRKAPNTIRRQDADLLLFADYLKSAGVPVGDFATDPAAWLGITWGLVEGFVKWQLLNGYAVDSVNVRLSTIKTYAQLALRAGALPVSEYAMIRTVKAYSHKEKPNIDATRQASGIETRRTIKARVVTKAREDRPARPAQARKKAAPIFLTKEQRDALVSHDGSQQGNRDALILLLMLDHGLRVGEVAGLQVADFNLSAGLITFKRPKTKQTDTHRLTDATLRAARAYFKYAPEAGNVWRNSAQKNEGKQARGKLTGQGMTPNGIYKRVELLGRKIGIDGLSPHDLRHTFAERAKHNATRTLQDAGGWNSPAMALRYQQRGAIANDGLVLED
jgi:integrase